MLECTIPHRMCEHGKTWFALTSIKFTFWCYLSICLWMFFSFLGVSIAFVMHHCIHIMWNVVVVVVFLLIYAYFMPHRFNVDSHRVYKLATSARREWSKHVVAVVDKLLLNGNDLKSMWAMFLLPPIINTPYGTTTKFIRINFNWMHFVNCLF